MEAQRAKQVIITLLLSCCLLAIINPPTPSLSTKVIFDDKASIRINEQSDGGKSNQQLIITISHDDDGPLTANFSRVQDLLSIEKDLLSGENHNLSYDSSTTYITRLETPFNSWSEAFDSKGRDIENASSWSDVLQPTIEEGWCGKNSTNEEQAALETTLLLLPKQTNLGVACPSFSGSSPTQPPQSNEILWLVWLDSESVITDWSELTVWCEKASDNSEYNFEPAGVNMLFKKAENIAEDDLNKMILPSILILGTLLFIGLRSLKSTLLTLGGVGMVLIAEVGLLSTLGHNFSVIDGIAIPIIMGVAVDGAFWYTHSSKDKEQVRKILFIAMLTTVAAVSIALFSQIKAQRSLALVMIIGIVLDWAMTRFILEDIYLSEKKPIKKPVLKPTIQKPISIFAWFWPASLIVLICIAITAPAGVEVLDIQQFLPEDEGSLDDLQELRDNYMIASGTIVWIVVDVQGDDPQALQDILDLQQQISQHPSIISYDTGLIQTKLVMGLSNFDSNQSDTLDSVIENSTTSILMNDFRLIEDDVTKGVAIAAFIDGENADAALDFKYDVEQLLEINNFSGVIGGDLPIGAELAKSFENSRIIQILLAGFAVFITAYFITGSYQKALRIAIGTIAIGIAVDGLASHLGGRKVSTAPAVLLGMGFAADYLSHASVNEKRDRSDDYARWGAALTSLSIFVLVVFSKFPPAQDTGQLLSISILLSALLATFASFLPVEKSDIITDRISTEAE
jgi:predicted RND superfamily exporter protein